MIQLQYLTKANKIMKFSTRILPSLLTLMTHIVFCLLLKLEMACQPSQKI